MDEDSSGTDSWRVVVCTNAPGGVAYTLIDNALRPPGHRIVGVITSQGPARRRGQGYLDVVGVVPPEVDVLVSNHPSRWSGIVSLWKPDLIISAGLPWLIPDTVLALPRLGGINIHPSLLPRHRGPNPVEWALRSGDRETGFSIHRLAAGFDTGAILAQTRIAIGESDSVETLFDRLIPRLPGLITEALERVARGDSGETQDEDLATYAGLFEPEWRFIDWSRSAREIHNQVRSWSGFGGGLKGAIGEIEGEQVLITRTRILTPQTVRPHGTPGTKSLQNGDQFAVHCGDGDLAILEWEPST